MPMLPPPNSSPSTGDFLSAMEADIAANTRMADLLETLAHLRKTHPSDALFAGHLINHTKGDWRTAADWLVAARDAINSHMRLLILSVALEGKEREQQTQNKG